jgi:DNA repair protein RecO (recombination protein O)
MSLIETEGLVLKTYNLAEADRIVLFLTHEHGLVRGVAKGAKRLKSKFGSGLEPYSVVRLTYFQKDAVELVSLQQVELLRSYFTFAADPQVLQKFADLADLLTAITPPNDPNKDLYRMVKACLEASSQIPDRLENISIYFELWLLRLGGYLPDWNRCERCKRTLEPNEPANLQSSFQLICGDCKTSRSLTEVKGTTRELFSMAQKFSPLRFAESASTDIKETGELSEILRRIFATAIGRDVILGKGQILTNGNT